MESLSNPSPWGPKIYMKEGGESFMSQKWQMDNSEETESSRLHMTDVRVNSQRWWRHAQGSHKSKPDHSPELREASGCKVPPLTEKLFAIETCWGRDNQFSLTEWHWVFQPQSKANPTSSWPTQNRLHVLVCYLFCFRLIEFRFVLF